MFFIISAIGILIFICMVLGLLSKSNREDPEYISETKEMGIVIQKNFINPLLGIALGILGTIIFAILIFK